MLCATVLRAIAYGGSSGAMQLAIIGPVVTPPAATAPVPSIAPSLGVRLDRGNFPLWRTLTVTHLSGASLHGYLDGSVAAPPTTISQGAGDAATTVANPAYATWWTQDQKVLGILLSSMTEDIASQLISCKSAAAAWTSIHAMFSAQNRAGVRHIRRQIQSLKKNDMTASEYMHKVKALADAMASAGSPLTDDEIIDYMLTGLGKAFNPIAASLSVVVTPVMLAEFYSMVLNYEALQLSQQADDEEWTSSANAVARSGAPAPVNRPRAPDTGRTTDVRPAGGYPQQQGQGYQHGGQDNRRNNGGGGGGNGRNGNRRWRPRCQISKNWGHEADTCKKRFDSDYSSGNGRSAYNASTSSNNSTHWVLDSGTTDHLTSDLERLQFRERYGGHDQVQVANGSGLSISHIGHSTLAGSSLRLNNILHVPNISQHLLSVYRLVSDNRIFIEFHKYFFLVKDKATRRILLRGRSKGGLYPLPLGRASHLSERQASSSVRVSSSQWHQRLGHPSKNVVSSIVRNNDLECSSSDTSALVCDACQCGKSRQLSYTASARVSTMPLELVHTDVWGPARASSGGYKYYVSFIDTTPVFAGSIY